MTIYPTTPRPLPDDPPRRAVERALVTPHEFGPYVAGLGASARYEPCPDPLLVRLLVDGWDLNPTEALLWTDNVPLLGAVFAALNRPGCPQRSPWSTVRRRERVRDVELACVDQAAFSQYALAMQSQHPGEQGARHVDYKEVDLCVREGFGALPQERFDVCRRNGGFVIVVFCRLLYGGDTPHWTAVRTREGAPRPF